MIVMNNNIKIKGCNFPQILYWDCAIFAPLKTSKKKGDFN